MSFLHVIGPAATNPWALGWDAAAAISTVLAVLLAGLALWLEARRSRRLQQGEWDRADRLRNQDLEKVAEQRHARAARLGLVIDHELFLYGGKLSNIAETLTDDQIAADPLGSIRLVFDALNGNELMLLSRFMDDLDVFSPQLAANLTMLIGAFNALKEAPPLEGIDEVPAVVFLESARSLREQLQVNIEHVRAARDKLRPLVDPFRGGQNIEFGSIAREARAEFDAAAKDA